MEAGELMTDVLRPELPLALLEGRVIAIARGLDAEALPAIAEALRGAGLRSLEVTLNSPDALEAIRRLAAEHRREDFAIGAGTVRGIDDAQAAVEAGATYLVAPHTDLAVVEWAAQREVPILPGALTPTEVVRAWDAGAAAVKVFPAGRLGPSYITDLLAPLPEVLLVPTGGVTPDDARGYLAAGAVAVGLGSALLGDGDPAGIRHRAERLLITLGSEA